jgi:hypothetical protein
MDRLDAIEVFIAALDAGSLAGAGRTTGRSSIGAAHRPGRLAGSLVVSPARDKRMQRFAE